MTRPSRVQRRTPPRKGRKLPLIQQIGESRSRVASNGNESGGAVRHGPRATAATDGDKRCRRRSAGRRSGVRAEQTDDARAKRTSGDWFLAQARSSRAGAGEDEAGSASHSALVAQRRDARRAASKVFHKNSPPGTALPATAGPHFSWCIVPYGSGATTPGGNDELAGWSEPYSSTSIRWPELR